MKKESGKLKKGMQIKVGVATKFKKVKFDVPKIITLYKSGKPVSQIALALGFPPDCGQNRTRRVLVKAGIYKAAKKAASKKTKAA